MSCSWHRNHEKKLPDLRIEENAANRSLLETLNKRGWYDETASLIAAAGGKGHLGIVRLLLSVPYIHDEDGVGTSSIITGYLFMVVLLSLSYCFLGVQASMRKIAMVRTSFLIGSCTVGNIEIVEVTSASINDKSIKNIIYI